MPRKRKDELTPDVTPPPLADPEVVDEESDIGEAEEAGSVELESGFEVLPAELDDASSPAEEAPLAAEEARPGANQIVRYDPLEAYLREIRGYPQISREEETALAIRYQQHKDLEAAYKLVTSNLWLVVKIAREDERAARGILDLIQEGNIGLMEAVKNFDPYRGVRFPSYATWWIKAYVVRYLIANWRMVKIGTTQAQRKLFFNLKKERDKLEREGFYPAPKLLAEKLKVKESEVVEMEQRLGGSDVSVDAPLQNADPDSNLLGVLPASQSNAEELLQEKRSRELILKGLDEFASTLNPKESIIFRERMLGEDKATLQDVAEKLSLSRERVRQLENRLKERLKVFLENKYGAALENIDF